MKRAKKPRQKTYTLTEKQVEMIKRSKEAARKRDERNKRAREEAQIRSYIRDTLEKRRRK